MESLTMHDLTAAYSLDALDYDEAREYEGHLATCDRCREELVYLSTAAGALAFAVESPAPPEALRSRILERARAERPHVRSLGDPEQQAGASRHVRRRRDDGRRAPRTGRAERCRRGRHARAEPGRRYAAREDPAARGERVSTSVPSDFLW